MENSTSQQPLHYNILISINNLTLLTLAKSATTEFLFTHDRYYLVLNNGAFLSNISIASLKYILSEIILCCPSTYSGPGSSVSIATGYRLDNPGIESRWGRDFPHLSRPALGPTQPPVQWVPGLSRG